MSQSNFAQVISSLRERGYFLTGAESLTGGMVAEQITSVPGASEVFLGSFVAYSHEFKSGAIGVSRDLMGRQGAVDAEVVAQMALGARAKAASFCQLPETSVMAFATTGVAGPSTSDGQPVGTVFIAVVECSGSTSVHQMNFNGGRELVRSAATERVAALLLEVFEGR